MTLVSILLPAYNAEATIDAQLRALSRQTFDGELEVIVADNGSTDGTRKVVEDAAGDLPVRIVLVDASSRRGPAHAVNVAAKSAHGDRLLICNADDIATESWVALMVEELHKHPFVAGPLQAFTREVGDRDADDYHVNVSLWSDYCLAGATANIGVARWLFEEVGGLDERFLAAEDIDFCARVFEYGVTLHRAAGVMWYRQRADPREWNRNLAWCISWDIAAQSVRRELIPESGQRRFKTCLRDFARQFVDYRRWPLTDERRELWFNQTQVKWGRIKGHMFKAKRLRGDGPASM